MAVARRGSQDRSGLVGLSWGRVFVTDVAPDASRHPPVVLVHDVLSCGHAFREVARAFAADRRVVVVDLPGAGESDRPPPREADDYGTPWLARALSEVMAEIGVPTADVVGVGFGALVMLQLGLDAPARVRRMCAVAPPLAGIQLAHEQRLARLPGVGELAFARAYRRADLRRALAAARAAPERMGDLTVSLYWDRIARDGGLAATRAMLLEIDRVAALVARLQELTQAVLFVWGDRDAWVPIAQAERSVALLSRARLSVVEGGGHALAEERPDLLTALALPWFDAEDDVAAD